MDRTKDRPEKLTDAYVAGITLPKGKKDALHFERTLKGFGVRITKGGQRAGAGRRVWLFQYRAGAKVRRQVIGEWPNMTAAKARKAAEQLRGASRGGADPVAERRAARAATAAAESAARARKASDAFTVDLLIGEWQRVRLAERSPSYQQEAPRRLRAGLKRWLDTPAAALNRKAAQTALDAAAAGQGPVAANRIRAYARACFGWAVKRDMLPSSPFANLLAPAEETARDRVLTDAELGRVWRASAGLSEPWRGLLQTLILTGQRRGEVAGMVWRELAADWSTWTIPADRSKNGHAHDVPLASIIRDMLANRPRLKDYEFVFSSGRKPRSGADVGTAPTGFGRMKLALDALLREPAADGKPTKPALSAWTIHDLRRTVATGLQRAGVRLEVTEAVLNHVSGSRSGIVGVYQRHAWTDEKRQALQAWAEHVQKIGKSF